jgi:hypothetical protein
LWIWISGKQRLKNNIVTIFNMKPVFARVHTNDWSFLQQKKLFGLQIDSFPIALTIAILCSLFVIKGTRADTWIKNEIPSGDFRDFDRISLRLLHVEEEFA